MLGAQKPEIKLLLITAQGRTCQCDEITKSGPSPGMERVCVSLVVYFAFCGLLVSPVLQRRRRCGKIQAPFRLHVSHSFVCLHLNMRILNAVHLKGRVDEVAGSRSCVSNLMDCPVLFTSPYASPVVFHPHHAFINDHGQANMPLYRSAASWGETGRCQQMTHPSRLCRPLPGCNPHVLAAAPVVANAASYPCLWRLPISFSVWSCKCQGEQAASIEKTNARCPSGESAVQREATRRRPPPFPSPGTSTSSLSFSHSCSLCDRRATRDGGMGGGKEHAARLAPSSTDPPLTDVIRSRVSAPVLLTMLMPSGLARCIGRVQERSSR